MSATTEKTAAKEKTMDELCRNVDFRAKSKDGKQYCLIRNDECPYYEPDKKVPVTMAGRGFGNSNEYTVIYHSCRRFD